MVGQKTNQRIDCNALQRKACWQAAFVLAMVVGVVVVVADCQCLAAPARGGGSLLVSVRHCAAWLCPLVLLPLVGRRTRFGWECAGLQSKVRVPHLRPSLTAHGL